MRIAVACEATGKRCGPFKGCGLFRVFHVVHSRILRMETWMPCHPRNATSPPPGCQVILCTQISRKCAADLAALGVTASASMKIPSDPQETVQDFLKGPSLSKAKNKQRSRSCP